MPVIKSKYQQGASNGHGNPPTCQTFRTTRAEIGWTAVMVPKNWLITSRRPCPKCGGVVQYKATLLTWLTNRYRRICTKCGYVDPEDVKFVASGRLEKTPTPHA